MPEARILYGLHTVVSCLRSSAAQVMELYVDSTRTDPRVQSLLQLAQSRGVKVLRVDARRLDGLAGGARHQGVAAKIAVERQQLGLEQLLEEITGPALLLVLDGVQDPHNLGACLRVADAFGVHAVIAPKDRATGITPVVSKVASGAAEVVPYVMVTNLARTLRMLKEREIWVVGAHEDGADDLHVAKLSGPLAWVMGAEGEGLRRLTREHCDELVRIPMNGTVESLNVSVAAGVCLWEACRQRGANRQKT